MSEKETIKDGKTEELYTPFKLEVVERPHIKVVYTVGKKPEIKKLQKL